MRTPESKKGQQRTPSTATRQENVEARTPTTSSLARPPREEMHPSKAQQSTTKQADSGLILGFNPIKKDANGKSVGMADNTPTKSTPFGTPGYEFKFGQDSQLSDEAKKLMDSVREDATRIRNQMILDKSNQDYQDQEAEKVHGDRKFAKPKGKAGRFSDVHMAEFKKMDSIAGHPSSFRATPGRLQPVTKSLKRTKSKAQLDEPEPQPSSIPRSPSKTSVASTLPNTATKRVKHNAADDTATIHNPKMAEKSRIPQKPAGPRARPAVRSSLMTPTRASMARSTSTIKAPKTSLIPSLARSPATKAVASPRTPRTEFNPRLMGHLPTFNNLKSILRRRQPLFSRDPAKIAAGTHVAAADFNPDSLLANQADLADSASTPSPKKHVEFTPSVKSRYDLTHDSPTRSKIPTTPSRSNLSDIVYPSLPTVTPEQSAASTDSNPLPPKSPTIRHVRKSGMEEKEVEYPELPVVSHGIAHGIGNKKRHRDEVDDDADDLENSENVPPADEERSTKRLKANPNPPASSPIKNRPIKTPVRAVSGRMDAHSATASAKKRGVLSLSRLNMLAKPKGRA